MNELQMTRTSLFQPGAAKYGNFINYYSFNPAENRIKVIPSDLLSEMNVDRSSSPVVCLDIGCNSGELTVALHSHLTPSLKKHEADDVQTKLYFLGIDIDSVLIARSRESNPLPSNVSFEHMDIMKEDSLCRLNLYLKKLGKEKFDLVTCFSVTMWIHLNHGDEGLRNFLLKISSITKFLLLEPQDWKCYKSAARRMKRLNQDGFDLKILKYQHDIKDYIDTVLEKDCGMKPLKIFGETSWSRELKLFCK